MRNIECKIELRDPALARVVLRTSGALAVTTLTQVDTYFLVPTGRFKRRRTEGLEDEFIRYDRQDLAKPRLSEFTIYSPGAAEAHFGAGPLTQLVEVRKTREVYLMDAVRVHIDHVEELGWFLEFESLVSQANSLQNAHEQVVRLRDLLRPALGEIVSSGYSDMLLEQRRQGASQSAGQ
jgi:adenylate cyclase class 2